MDCIYFFVEQIASSSLQAAQLAERMAGLREREAKRHEAFRAYVDPFISSELQSQLGLLLPPPLCEVNIPRSPEGSLAEVTIEDLQVRSTLNVGCSMDGYDHNLSFLSHVPYLASTISFLLIFIPPPCLFQILIILFFPSFFSFAYFF